MAKKTRFTGKINIKNKRARHDYELLDKYTAGIVLKGTEIKSIREGKVSLQESYCLFNGDELFVRGMNIAQYQEAGIGNHEPTRERKLLLNRSELRKLEKKNKEKGLTIVPTRLFINNRGLAKMEVHVARGKKLYDKREALKEKDMKRELKRLKL